MELRDLTNAIASVKASGLRAVAVAPRVLKPEESLGIWAALRDARPDAVLARSAGLALIARADEEARDIAIFGDTSLNAANAAAARQLVAAGDLQRLAPAFDLDAAQLAALAEQLGGDAAELLECVLYARLPLFYTEHCVFARHLSDGSSYRDCGHPCETATVHLVDEAQRRHRVIADCGCRNTVFDATPTSAAPFLVDFHAAGIRRYRVELARTRRDVYL